MKKFTAIKQHLCVIDGKIERKELQEVEQGIHFDVIR